MCTAASEPATGPTFSEFYKLGKSQPELDFVDVPLETDIPLYMDPFAISQRVDPWSRGAHETILDFFQRTTTAIREGNVFRARKLMGHLREPNETRLGLSKGRPRGAGLGRHQAQLLLEALSQSSAVSTGLLSSLEECELVVDGVGRDKLSDLTTNVIRSHLVQYTREQCELLSVPIQEVPVPPSYDPDQGVWRSQYVRLPVDDRGMPVLLVPKSIVRYEPAYDHQHFHRRIVLEFLQAEHLRANSSLVQTLKSGERRVTKKALLPSYPCTRKAIAEVVSQHPHLLKKYRSALKQAKASVVPISDEREVARLARILSDALRAIAVGSGSASQYHSLMVGVLEMIFFPLLVHPKKEQEIHDGRKRIDILMENADRTGIFSLLQSTRGLGCPFVAIECKNYREDVANPELDQLSGRFSRERGKVGLLCCRQFDDRARFVARCRDTLKDGRGLIIPLDDERVLRLLGLLGAQNRRQAVQEFGEMVREVWLG